MKITQSSVWPLTQWTPYFWLLQVSGIWSVIACVIAPVALAQEPNALSEITAVSQLADVQPMDWAFAAVRSLMEQNRCLAGNQASQSRKNTALTREEFAAGLNQCFNTIHTQLATQQTEIATNDDRVVLQRLQEEFAAELASLSGRTESLDIRTTSLEAQQFSPTARLSTSLVATVSDLVGDRADGNSDTRIQSDISLSYRMRLNLVSSFTGRDRLLVRLQSSNRVPNFSGLSGTEMTRLSYEVGNTDNRLTLNLLEYRLPIGDKLNIFLYGNSASHHYYTNYLNPYFASFGGSKGSPSRFTERNPIYRIGDIIGAGVGAVYRFNPNLRLDLGYLARNADSLDEGLFGGTYSALAQLSLKPTTHFEFGLTYSSTKLR